MHFTLKFVSGLELQGESVKATVNRKRLIVQSLSSPHTTAQPWPVVKVRLTESELVGVLSPVSHKGLYQG